MAADAQLLGRVTYEGFAKAWPTMEGTGEFGEKMNAMPKFVVSSTLEDPTWNNTTVLGGDSPSEVGRTQGAVRGRHPRRGERAARPGACSSTTSSTSCT